MARGQKKEDNTGHKIPHARGTARHYRNTHISRNLASQEKQEALKPKNLTDIAWLYISNRSTENITSLDLSECNSSITDDVLVNLARKLRNLESIQVSTCSKIGNDALAYLVSSNRNLRHLDISECIGIDSNWIKNFLNNDGENLPNPHNGIETLVCERTSMGGNFLNSVTAAFPNLKHINIMGCPIQLQEIEKFTKENKSTTMKALMPITSTASPRIVNGGGWISRAVSPSHNGPS